MKFAKLVGTLSLLSVLAVLSAVAAAADEVITGYPIDNGVAGLPDVQEVPEEEEPAPPVEDLVDVASVERQAEAPTVLGVSLARTGVELITYVLIAVVLLGIGGAFLRSKRGTAHMQR